MALLRHVVNQLDSLFGVRQSAPDPAFSRFVPMVYGPAGTYWQERFEADFARRFNGLMLRGDEEVCRVFLIVFPAEDVLDAVLAHARAGDLVFSHHPLDMRCGDPRGDWGDGFRPIAERHLDALRSAGVSFYSCHAPMDTHRQIGTTAAMVEALGGRYVGGFMPYGNGFAGAICDIDPLSSEALAERVRDLLEVPYVFQAGPEHAEVTRVAIVPGCGDDVPSMVTAAEMGAQAYVTGEVHCHIDNDYGRSKMGAMREYLAVTPMAMIGGSHAASEFLVMRTQMAGWFERELGLEACPIEPPIWWR